MGDGFIKRTVVLNSQLLTMFQREFRIGVELGDKTAPSLVAFALLIGLAWVSKGHPMQNIWESVAALVTVL